MHWTDAYIGQAYVPGVYDCADLVERVTGEVFGRTVVLPKDRPGEGRGAAYQALLQEHLPRLCERVDLAAASDGDIVQMTGAGRLNHVGLLAHLAGEPWVLHNSINARVVVLHRLRNLERFGLAVEGVYRWI